VQSEIQAILRQITASVSFLPMLEEACTFDLLGAWQWFFWQWINGSTGLLVQKIWSSGSVFEAAGTIFVLS
jgi:hypothetical protein